MWDILDTLTPNDFNAFRDHLGTASGLQSYMYRALEFVLGNKSVGGRTAHVQREVTEAFAAPSLWDTATSLLSRHGYDIEREHLDRDVTAAYEPNRSVETAWLSIYKEQNRFHELGEALMAVAAAFTNWRMRHLVTVERLIGFKPGTGGATGVTWLRTIADHRFFPELWTVRTELD